MKKKHSNHSQHRFCTILKCIASISFLLAIAVIMICRRLCFTNYTQYCSSESTDSLSNPYIGWYTIHGYLLAEDAALNVVSSADTSASLASTASAQELSLIEINLKNYADCDLTDTALTQIDSILSAWGKTGSQLIVRFLYDWDGQNLQSEPSDLSQILTHMDQVASIINQYASSIYLLQGIFVGNWGEMNNTTHMGNGQMQTLIEKLADVTDPSIFLSVRTPSQWRSIVGEENGSGENQTKTASANGDTQIATVPVPVARLGLFNDGMLGSANDTGTYGDKVASDASTLYSDAWTREDELAFQNELCRYVPNGGEVITDNVYNDFDNAIHDLAQMHVSYLNSAYDPAVLDKWRQTIVDGETESNEIWNGMNGYDYIGRHLGYRYVLDSSSWNFHPLFDQTGLLTIDIKNVGFSNCYRPLEVLINVVSDRTGECVACVMADTDPRSWDSGTTSEFTVPIDVRSLDNTDTYTLYLECSDPSLERTILFANTQPLTKYGYQLGTIAISNK